MSLVATLGLAFALTGSDAQAQRRPPPPRPGRRRPPKAKPPKKPVKKQAETKKVLPASYVSWRSTAWTSLGLGMVGGGLAATGATLSLLDDDPTSGETLMGLGAATWGLASLPMAISGFGAGQSLRNAGSGVGNGAGIVGLSVESVGVVFGVLMLTELGDDDGDAARWGAIALGCTVPAVALSSAQLLTNRNAVAAEGWSEPWLAVRLMPVIGPEHTGVMLAGRF